MMRYPVALAVLAALTANACKAPTVPRDAQPPAVVRTVREVAGAAPLAACAALTGQTPDRRQLGPPDPERLAARLALRPRCGSFISTARVVRIAPLLLEVMNPLPFPDTYFMAADLDSLASASVSFGAQVLVEHSEAVDVSAQPARPRVVMPVLGGAVPRRGVLIKYQRAGGGLGVRPSPALTVYDDGTLSYDVIRSLPLQGGELEALLRLFAAVGFDALPEPPAVEGSSWGSISLVCARLQTVALPRPDVQPLVDALEALLRRAQEQMVTRVFAGSRRRIRYLDWSAPVGLAALAHDGERSVARSVRGQVPAAMLAFIPAEEPAYFREGKTVYRVGRARGDNRYSQLAVSRCRDATESLASTTRPNACVLWPASSHVDLAAVAGFDGAIVTPRELDALRPFYQQLQRQTYVHGSFEYGGLFTRNFDPDVPLHVQLDTRPRPDEVGQRAMVEALARATAQPPARALATLSATCATLPSCAGECAAAHAAHGRGGLSPEQAFASCPRIAFADEGQVGPGGTVRDRLVKVFVRYLLGSQQYTVDLWRAATKENGVLFTSPREQGVDCEAYRVPFEPHSGEILLP